MLDFKSIPTHLQISIAEKIDYLDQRELHISSKLGKDVVNTTKHKAVFEVTLTVFDDERLFVWNNQRHWNWSDIRNQREFPLFKVSELSIMMCTSLDLLMEIDAKAGFVRSDVSLSWGTDPISPSLFLELPEIFNITRLQSTHNLDPIMFSLPRFLQMNSVDLRPHGIPDETLLKLKSENIFLNHTNCSSNMLITANNFFQQWMQKERNINFLNIHARLGRLKVQKGLLLHGLSVSIVKEYEEKDEYEGDRRQRKRKRPIREALKFWIRTVGSGDSDKKTLTMNKLYKGDILCTIDRGDKKLLIYASGKGWSIQAQEFDELKEVFYLDDEKADHNY